MDGPTHLKYQCTSHGAMVGNIYIADARVASGSFSGSFQGDGSALTNLPASNPFPFTGDAQITGSLEITGSITTFIQGQRNLFLPSNGDIVIGKSATNATGYNDVVIGRDAAGANGYGVTIGQLKSVFQRCLGAFNTSHSPRVTSAKQWAHARVNAYMYLVKNGRPQNAKYTTDYDLLPKKHPKSSKK